jgi:hypothetical protein
MMTGEYQQRTPRTANPRVLALSFATLGSLLSYGYFTFPSLFEELSARTLAAQERGWTVDWLNGTGCLSVQPCASYLTQPLARTVFAPFVGDYSNLVLAVLLLLALSLLGPALLLNRKFQESAADNLKGLVLSFALGLGAGALTHFLGLTSWPGFALLFSPVLAIPKLVGQGRPLAPYNASFATQKDVADMLERRPSGRSILLGEKPEWRAFVTSRPGAQRRKELEHVLIVAPTRGGKGLHLQTQAYAWNGSLVIVDIKGEMHRKTAKHRLKKGPVFVLDPKNPVDIYDPFEDLREEEEIRTATRLILDTGDAENKIFEDRATYAFLAIIYTAKAILKGLELGLFDEEGAPAPPTWSSPVGGVVNMLPLGSKELYEAITGLRTSGGGFGGPFGGRKEDNLSPEARHLRETVRYLKTKAQALLKEGDLDEETKATLLKEVLSPLEKAHKQMRSFYGTGEDEKFRESSWSILTASLQAFTSDGVLATLTRTERGGRILKARYLAEGAPMEEDDEEGEPLPVTVYLRFPESELTATLPVLKLIELGLFAGALRTIDALASGFSEIPILWAFDEAGRAPVPELPNAVSTWAGRNMYALIYVQDLSQLQDAYKESGAETVLANTLQVFYTGNPNRKTAEYVSSRLGKFSAESAGYTYGEVKSENRSFTPRELITPEEFSSRTYPGATDDDVIIFPRGRPPVLARRVTPWGLLKVPQ